MRQVDAALDLSHTQNIGRMIKSHFPYSQFIVVSLKEGMFSNANVLFRTKFVDGVSAVTRTLNARRCAALVFLFDMNWSLKHYQGHGAAVAMRYSKCFLAISFRKDILRTLVAIHTVSLVASINCSLPSMEGHGLGAATPQLQIQMSSCMLQERERGPAREGRCTSTRATGADGEFASGLALPHELGCQVLICSPYRVVWKCKTGEL